MLYIPFQQYDYIGGPSSFMKNLKNYLDKNNFIYSKEYSKNDDIFFAIKYDLEIIKKVKANKKRVIQRLDGTHIPPEKLKPIKKIYKNYADLVIFQSKHSKEQCFKRLGSIPKYRYEIIINGVDKSIFFPNYTINLNKTIKFVITGNLLQSYKIEPSIYALDKISSFYDVELHIAGPVSEEVKKLIDRDYIIYHGALDLNGIAELLRTCHVFLFTVPNTPCPNSVIEAISTGLPVVSFNTGAMPELCWFSQDLLVPVSNSIFHEYNDFNFDNFTETIKLCIENYDKYREIALKNSNLYSFDECGEKYIRAFEKSKNIKYKKNIINRFFNIFKHTLINKYSLKVFIDHVALLPSKYIVNIIITIIEKRIKHMSKDEALIFVNKVLKEIHLKQKK